MEFTKDELEDRIKLVIKELNVPPTEDVLSQVPYWNDLLIHVKPTFDSLDKLYQGLGDEILSESLVDFPSEDQEETTTQILEKKKIIIRDAPGTGKTAPPLKAIYAIEQLVAEGPIKTVITAPSHVISAWESKLESYTTEPRNHLTITSSNRHESVETLKNDKTIDTVLLTYDSIFRPVSNDWDTVKYEELNIDKPLDVQNGHNVELVDAIVEHFLDGEKIFNLIGDEIHHTNHPGALRSMAFRKLAERADYFTAMTGTLFPNFLDDIYELISLMDNENFKTAENAKIAYNDNQKFIRMFLHRFGKNPAIKLTDIEGMPKVNDFDYRWFDLNDQETEIYNHVLNYKEFLDQEKFVLLRLISSDASLILPENYSGSKNLVQKLGALFEQTPGLRGIVENTESTKYKELDAVIEEVLVRREKAVVYTKYRAITKQLEKRYQEKYSHFNTRRIDGSISADPKNGQMFSDRDGVRLEFQTNPDDRLLFATIDSLREGQDVHAANNVIFLQQEIYPGPNDQALARVGRRGQDKDVNCYIIGAQGTPDFGVYLVDLIKRLAIDKVEMGFQLSDEQISLLERNQSLVSQPQIKMYLENAHSVVRRMSGQMLGKGPEENKKYLDVGENARLYAQGYNHLWEFTYSAHTARLIKKLVNEIETNNNSGLEKILDLGSGPATVARVLERKTTILDINPYQVKIGKKEAEKLGIDIEAIVGYTEDTEKFGVKSDEYDLAVLSLNLHYGNTSNGDRKRTIMEANRALKKDSYLIITLPESTVGDDGLELLESGLYNLGFDVIAERTGLVRAIDAENLDYKVYVAVARKRENTNKSLYSSDEFNDLFVLNPQFGYSDHTQKSQGNGKGHFPTEYNLEKCDRFEYINTGVRLVNPKTPNKGPNEPNRQPYIPSATPLSDLADPTQVVDWLTDMLKP